MDEKVLIVKGDTITTLYSDDVRELGASLNVTRASDVEWSNDLQGWVADIRALSIDQPGTQLGPFPTREAALAAEVAFIQARL